MCLNKLKKCKVDELDSIIDSLKEELRSLLNSKLYNIVEAEKKKNIHGVPGVYLIRRPDTQEIIYAGRTRTSTISGRMHQHLHMKERSNLQMMLKKYPDYPQDKTTYNVQYLEVTDHRKRLFLESFIISVLQPPFNS